MNETTQTPSGVLLLMDLIMKSPDYYDKLDAENNLPGSLAPTDSTVQEEQGCSGELGLTKSNYETTKK